jgi:four helix bundle protein
VSSASANSRRPRADRSTGSGKCTANYRATCRAKSKKDFIAKLGTVIEESDESSFWLEYLVATELLPLQSAKKLHSESVQLVAIFTTSQKTARANYLTERNRRRALGRRRAREQCE